MIVIPAIDIKGGKVVRLRQGRFDEVTEYSSCPLETAKTWINQGARWIHVVDLDGAERGRPLNLNIIREMARTLEASLEVGGGIRSETTIEDLIQSGVRRVVLGTRVIEDRDFLKKIISRWPDNIAVALDCRNGRVAQRGWQDTTGITAADFARQMQDMGVRCLIYTDISRDGMLQGPNIDGIKDLLKKIQIPIIASGGVSGLGDINQLNDLKTDQVLAVIVGKALYEKSLDLAEAIRLCSPKE